MCTHTLRKTTDSSEDRAKTPSRPEERDAVPSGMEQESGKSGKNRRLSEKLLLFLPLPTSASIALVPNARLRAYVCWGKKGRREKTESRKLFLRKSEGFVERTFWNRKKGITSHSPVTRTHDLRPVYCSQILYEGVWESDKLIK